MPLPTYAVIGVAKGGTSTLAQMLARHPHVHRAERKEVHFFDRHFTRGLDWYAEQFDPGRGEVHIGEATPIYIWDPRSRRRMARSLPGLRCLVILRDPANRAYSHYWHRRRYGGEDLSFENAIAAEPERLAVAQDLRSRAHVSYLDRGRYAEQLTALTALYPREQVHVTFLDDLVRDPMSAGRAALEFLGADPRLMPSWELPHNNPWHPLTPNELRRLRARGEQIPPSDGYPPMRDETRAQLRDHFDAADRELQDLLGRPLPWRS